MTQQPIPQAWRRQLADAVQDPAELLRRLDLPPQLLADAEPAGRLFRLRVPEPFLARMRRGDPEDPLLRQVLPLQAEFHDPPGYDTDPLSEARRAGTPGLIEKYAGRSLLVTTGACAINCRYCFRRHFPYHAERGEGGRWDQALARIEADRDTEEVILSGGDPLVLDDRRLARLADRLEAIGHVRRLRIHTRLPVVLPDRVDAELLDWLSRTRLRVIMVIHSNHPDELDDAVRAAMERLAAAGITLFNQAVLLAGVNDRAETLIRHSQRLFECRVMPYYLHLLDPVSGAAHFDVPETRGRALMRAVSARLPGYLVPKLAREEPGEPSKTVITTGNG